MKVTVAMSVPPSLSVMTYIKLSMIRDPGPRAVTSSELGVYTTSPVMGFNAALPFSNAMVTRPLSGPID